MEQKFKNKNYEKHLNISYKDFNNIIIKTMVEYTPKMRISLNQLEIALKNLILHEIHLKKHNNDNNENYTKEVLL